MWFTKSTIALDWMFGSLFFLWIFNGLICSFMSNSNHWILSVVVLPIPAVFHTFWFRFIFYMIVKNIFWCKCNIHVWWIKVTLVDQFTSSAFSIFFTTLFYVSISPFTRWKMHVFLDDTFYLCSYQMHWETR